MVRAAIAGDEDAIAHLEGRAVGAEDETDVDDDFVRVAFFNFRLDGCECGLSEKVGWDADGVGKEG